MLLITASPICQSLAAILLIKVSPAIALKKASYKKQLKGGDNKKGPKARENEGHKIGSERPRSHVVCRVNAICATRGKGVSGLSAYLGAAYLLYGSLISLVPLSACRNQRRASVRAFCELVGCHTHRFLVSSSLWHGRRHRTCFVALK